MQSNFRLVTLCLLLSVLSAAIAQQEAHAALGLGPEILAIQSFAEQSSRLLSVQQAKLLDQLAAALAGLRNLGPHCRQDVTSWVSALREGQLWAWRFIDAMGKPPSGILMGNVMALGSFWECVNTTQKFPGGAQIDPIQGQYCKVAMQPGNMTLIYGLIFRWGVCMPDTCNSTESKVLVQMALQLAGKIPQIGPIFSSLKVLDTTCQLNDLPLTGLAISGICVVAVFACLVLIGTVYETLFFCTKGHIKSRVSNFFRQFTVKPLYFKLEEVPEGNCSLVNVRNPEDTGENQTDFSKASASRESKPMEIKVDATDSRVSSLHVDEIVEKNFLGKWISAFSARQNAVAIFNTKSSAEQLDCLNGLRFLSMAWIICAHVYSAASPQAVDKFLIGPKLINSFAFQIIINGTFSVDTFFVLSGLLTVYITLKYLRRAGGPKKFSWHLYYIHRYLRLTPAYGIMIFLSVAIYPYATNGPLWNQEPNQSCMTYWWTNLIYINNFYKITSVCFGHTWYLANDMQFFILSPLVIIPLFLAPLIGIGVIVFLVLVSVTSSAVIAAVNDFSANPITAGGGGPETDSLGPIAMGVDIYVKPYCRVGAYAVGMLVGYILFRFKGKIRMSPWLVIFGWGVSTALACTVLFSLRDSVTGLLYSGGEDNLTTAESAAYYGFSRIAWALSIAWIIVACTNGYGGWVNDILSWKFFAPLARLTYCAYLSHPLLITILFSMAEFPIDARFWPIFYYFCGNIIVAYLFSLVFVLLFESPFLVMEKLMFGH